MSLFAVFLLLQLVLAGLPNTMVAQIRNGVRWIGQPINWFEANSPEFSVIHLVMFILISSISHFAFPRASFPRLLFFLMMFAVLTEMLQLFVPGRAPGAADFIANLLGILIGLGIVFVGSVIVRRNNPSVDDPSEF